MRKEILDLHERILGNTAKNHTIFREDIEYLKKLLNLTDLDFFEKGWIYWHLQDHYALLRDSDNELKIFKVFIRFIKAYDDKYLFWAVSDMTQALTMRLGGYRTSWDEIFTYANTVETNTEEFVRMKFEMNRAYIGIFTDERVLIDNKSIEIALRNIKGIINSYPTHPDILFFKMTLYASKIKYYNYVGLDICSIEKKLKSIVALLNESLLVPMINLYNGELLFGSWKQISIAHGSHYSARVGLTNVLFALCEAEKSDTIHYLLKYVKLYKLENKRLIGMIDLLNT